MGAFLAAEGLTPDIAVTSDARRAKQTLDSALSALPVHVAQIVENTIYSASADHLLEVLRQTPDKVTTLLAVGHNPGFGELANALAYDGAPDDLRHMREKFPTAALAVLDFAIDRWIEAAFGGARLQRFIVPADLRDGDGDEAE